MDFLETAYVSQELAYLGNDAILCLHLCLGVRALIYFLRRPTVCTHNCRRAVCRAQGQNCLAPDVSDSVRSPVNTIALALKTKLSAGNKSLV
jgi:hypothetical protein